MASHAIQPVWALHETARETFSIAREVLVVATSDNVQPIALLAVEAFGNTLAICQQTQLLIEKEARKQHTSHVVKFLKAKIGYSAHDSAMHLSSTSAGVRFLSLAAALLCLSSTFVGAEALYLMIKASAKEDQLLPTIYQLQDLLKALDYKLLRTRFADDVVGWEIFLFQNAKISPVTDGSFGPAVDVLEKLVAAFRTLSRVGEDDNVRYRITASNNTPWIIAFTKWCLGIPPTLIGPNGSTILSQPTARVTLCISVEGDIITTIEAYRELKSPTELWSQNPKIYDKITRWTGIISIRRFGERRLMDAAFLGDFGHQALCQALLYTPTQVKGLFTFLSSIEGGRDRPNFRTPNNYFQWWPDLWPADTKIASTLTEFLNLPSPTTGLKTLKKGQTFSELPLVATYLSEATESCTCRKCRTDGSRYVPCVVDKFISLVVDLTAEILVLSLFDTVEPVLVAISPHTSSPGMEIFKKAVRSILCDSRPSFCEVGMIFEACSFLVGHEIPQQFSFSQNDLQIGRNWVASAFKGQVIYPRFFETMQLGKGPLLSLTGGPGQLEHNGTRVDIVTSGRTTFVDLEVRRDVSVNGPQNLLQDEQLTWQVKFGPKRLELSCGITGLEGNSNPMNMLLKCFPSLDCLQLSSRVERTPPRRRQVTKLYHTLFRRIKGYATDTKEW